MDNKICNLFFRSIIIFTCLISGLSGFAQTDETQSDLSGDTLSLDQIMTAVIQNYPAIKEAEESLNKADAGLGLARSGYYPNIDATINASHVSPVPSLEVPGMGSFELFPENNFNASLNIYQNIYDFGKTSSNIAYANGNKELLTTTVEITKQKIATLVVRNYYALVFLQKAINIKDEQLKTLQEHLDFVKKKKATGSGTDYEILATQVKISGIENQKLDLIASHDIQLATLNILLGLPARTFHAVKEALDVKEPEVPEDSMISYALQHRNEMQVAQKKIDQASLHLDMVKAKNNPSVNFIANGGWKNGYIPDLNKLKANFVVGVGVKVPVFDGTRQKYNVMMAQSSVESSTLESTLTQRNISKEVIENETNLKTAAKKVKQAELQLTQSQEAYKLAQVSYSAGTITNLDLLDAATAVSESKLMVLKSKIDYTVNVYLLKTALGEQLY